MAGFSKRRPEPLARAGLGTSCSSQDLLQTQSAHNRHPGEGGPAARRRDDREEGGEGGPWLRAGQGHGKDQSWRQGRRGGQVAQTGSWVGLGGL